MKEVHVKYQKQNKIRTQKKKNIADVCAAVKIGE